MSDNPGLLSILYDIDKKFNYMGLIA